MKMMIDRAINKNIETKSSCMTTTDGIEILHNSFVILNNTMLQTFQGTADPEASATLNRIGDKVNLRGVKLSMFIELNERYSDVTFRLLVVKSAKGDNPSRTTLFNNLSGNKMLDTTNNERYTIMAQKWFKIRAPNTGIAAASFAGGYDNVGNAATFSKGTKIVKLWIPGRKFNKSGIITYENGSSQPKFYDYHALLFAYANFGTAQDLFFVGRVNDYVQQMYYKDA